MAEREELGARSGWLSADGAELNWLRGDEGPVYGDHSGEWQWTGWRGSDGCCRRGSGCVTGGGSERGRDLGDDERRLAGRSQNGAQALRRPRFAAAGEEPRDGA
ncbi:uncharacterized protein A4U43_C08F30390 [Asparagus officinalis]|nr:uncharacterized protein A4U43_C08F30390 [Asparagus officinalis]